MIITISILLRKKRGGTMCNNRSDTDISLEYHTNNYFNNTYTQHTKQGKVSIANYSNCGTSDICLLNEQKCVYTTKLR